MKEESKECSPQESGGGLSGKRPAEHPGVKVMLRILIVLDWYWVTQM